MGWWNARWDGLEPETIRNIKSQSSKTGINVTEYRCGCEATAKAPEILHLCDWHEGFESGLAIGRDPNYQ